MGLRVDYWYRLLDLPAGSRFLRAVIDTNPLVPNVIRRRNGSNRRAGATAAAKRLARLSIPSARATRDHQRRGARLARMGATAAARHGEAARSPRVAAAASTCMRRATVASRASRSGPRPRSLRERRAGAQTNAIRPRRAPGGELLESPRPGDKQLTRRATAASRAWWLSK